MKAIQDELLARGIEFDEKTKWKNLIKKLKENEGDKKYFKPMTQYDNFKWNATHFSTNGDVI